VIPDDKTRTESAQRTLLYAGTGLSVVAVLVALIKTLSGAIRPMRGIEILPFAFLWVIMAAWVLSPYWVAFKQGQRSSKKTGAILNVALALMITIQTTSFIATTFVYPGGPRHTNDGITILAVPLAQWLVLIVANLLWSSAYLRAKFDW